MRKWLIGVIGLAASIVIILLLLPLAFGLHADSLLGQMNGMRMPVKKGDWGIVEFTVTDIERGWWHSTATIGLSYAPPQSQKTDQAQTTAPAEATNASSQSSEFIPVLEAKALIVHGPILWRPNETQKHPFFGQAWFDVPVDYVIKNIPERFIEVTGVETGELMGYVSLLGEQVYYLSSNEISYQDASGQLNFSGFNLEAALSGEDLAFNLAAPHFNFVLYPPEEDPQAGLRWLMDNIEIQFKGALKEPGAFLYGTWLGDAVIMVGNLQVDVKDEHYSVNRLVSTTQQKEGHAKDLLDGNSQFKIESLDINQHPLGPIEVKTRYANLDRAAIEDVRKLYENWIASNSDQPFFAWLTPEQHEEIFSKLFILVNRLPAYNIDSFSLGTPAGVLKGDFGFQVMLPAEKISDLQSLGYWQKSIDAKLDIDAPPSLAENYTAWVLERFYNYMNPLIALPPTSSNPQASQPETQPGPTAPKANVIDYHAEAQNLLKQAQLFGVIKNMNNDYVLKAHYQQGLLIINDKPIFDFSNKQTKEPQ